MKVVKRISIAAICSMALVMLTQCKPRDTNREDAAERATKLQLNATKACTERDITVGGVAQADLCTVGTTISCEFKDGKCDTKVPDECEVNDKDACNAVGGGNKCLFEEDSTINKCFNVLPVGTTACADFGSRKTQCELDGNFGTTNEFGCRFDVDAKICKSYTACADIPPGKCTKSTRCELSQDGQSCGPKTPVEPGANTVKEVALNATNTCIINEKDNVVCFPAMVAAQDDSATASPAATITVKNITAGDAHFCAQTLDGKPVCWGKVTAFTADLPTVEVTQVAAGTSFTCWIKKDDFKVVCKGADVPNIEKGTTKDGSNAQNFANFTWSSISVGDEHVCGVLKADVTPAIDGVDPKAGEIFCFGANADKVSNPILLASKATKLSLTKTHTVYLANGELTVQAVIVEFADKSFVEQNTKTPAVDVSAKDALSALYTSSNSALVCGKKADGKIVCSNGNKASLVDLTGFDPAAAKSVAVGDAGVCAIDKDSKLVCKGNQGEIPAEYKPAAVAQ